MFELWAKRRPIKGKGFQYEWICNFERFEQSFYMMDQLDRNIYQECMVLNENTPIFYREFTEHKKKKLRLF